MTKPTRPTRTFGAVTRLHTAEDSGMIADFADLQRLSDPPVHFAWLDGRVHDEFPQSQTEKEI